MKKRIFSYIENAEALAVELETELCRRPAISPDSGGTGEGDKAEFLTAWLGGRGFDTIERYDAPDPRAKGGVRPSLVLTIPGNNKDGSRLWIMSHLDVVPPGEAKLWNSDPWTVIKDDGPPGPRLIGRGVEDNQQGLVSSVLAALALAAAGVKPERTVKLLFVADEENGSGYGIVWLMKNHRELFHKDDLVLIPDGGDSRGETIEIAEKNQIWGKFTTQGKQSHGSRPDLGKNAHLAGADLALNLHYGLAEKFGETDPLFESDHSTFEPTKKDANVPNINTIPGSDVFYMDMRILPRYPVSAVNGEIKRIISEIEKKHGVTVEYEAVQSNESKPTSADSPLVAQISRAAGEVYGVKTRPVGIGGGTVGAFLRNEGIDSAVWGRMDDTAHQPNEYALIANILGDAKVMTLLMLEKG
ncbi:MAG: M20 family metallo-hydrolase [Treponema sp.]|nr:M20 family metallo-hydrolase [Treponema sp.]